MGGASPADMVISPLLVQRPGSLDPLSDLLGLLQGSWTAQGVTRLTSVS